MNIQLNAGFTNQTKVEGKVGAELDELSLDIEDSKLIEISNNWISTALQKKSELDKEYDKWKTYYLGTQLGDRKRINYNRVFTSVETIIPIATADVPVPNVLPAQKTYESVILAQQWEKILMYIYKNQKTQRKLEKALRHLFIGKYACFKYFFDKDSNEIKTIVVHPKDLIFDNDKDIDEGLNWIGHKLVKTAGELIDDFPEKKEAIQKEVGGKLGTEISYTEIWTNDFVFWRFKNIVLGKAKNPNWNYKNEAKNFFDTPQMPFVFINAFDLGESISGSTGLIEQAAALQDGIDKRKNQIDKNADIINGKVIGSGANGLKAKEFSEIDWSNPHEGIFMAKGEAGDIQRVTGSPLPQFVENDMLHSEGGVDNIMGTHGTTRGEREGRETAAGRSILREGDRGRIDMFGRRLEEAVEDLFKGWTQLVKVWYQKKKLVMILNSNNAKEFLEFDGDSIEEGIEIEIIPGTLIPEDKASRQQRALTLANAQLIDPITLYEELGVRNPRMKAERLFKWQESQRTGDVSGYLEEVGKTGDAAEREANRQILEAREESRRIIQGVPVPPNQQADRTHIGVHELFMNQQDFQSLSPEIKQLYMQHLEGETNIVEQNNLTK